MKMAKIQSLGANRTLLQRSDGSEILISYSTPVAAFIPARGYVRTEITHSRTTSKHIGLYSRSYKERLPQSFFDALL
jgi:hypothetical protein